MKIDMKNYKKLGFALLAMAVGFSSCTKQDGIYAENGSSGIVELADLPSRTSSTAYASVTKSFDAVTEVDCPILINYTGVNGAPEDVTVTLGLDATIVSAMSTSTAVLTNLDASLYTVPSYTVTIPKGQKQGIFHIKLKTSAFDFSKSYALGVVVKSTSSGTVSGNYGSGLFKINAKNAYDGIYTVGAGSSVTRYTAPGVPANDALSGSIAGNPNLTLSTVSATAVEITNLKWAGGTSGVSGIDNLRATVDPATNLVTMTSLGNTTLANIAGKDNKYDPATKTFTLNFRWNPTSTTRDMTLVIKYASAR